MRSKSLAKNKLISCKVSESQPEKQSMVPWKGRRLVKENRKMKGKVVAGSRKNNIEFCVCYYHLSFTVTVQL
jgi:hypothetical protein